MLPTKNECENCDLQKYITLWYIGVEGKIDLFSYLLWVFPDSAWCGVAGPVCLSK